MRSLLALLLVIGPAAAQAPAPDEVISFSRAQLEKMLSDLETMVTEREGAAFQAGKQDATMRCRNIL